MVELVRLLRSFVAAADGRNHTDAGKQIGVDRSTLERHIRELGERAEVELMDGNGVTTEGALLLQDAREALHLIDETQRTLESLSRSVEVVYIAVSHTVAESVLPELMVRWHREDGRRHEARGACIVPVNSNSSEVCRMVRDAQKDFGIAAEHRPRNHGAAEGLDEHRLFADEVVVACPSGHPWARLTGDIPIETFLSESIILRDPGSDTRRALDTALGDANRALLEPPHAEIGNTTAALQEGLESETPVVISNLSMTGSWGESFVAKRIRGVNRMTRTFALVTPSARPLRPAAEAVITFFKANARNVIDDLGLTG